MNTFKLITCCLSIIIFSELSIQAQATLEGKFNLIQQQIADCKSNIENTQAQINELKETGFVSYESDEMFAEWKRLEEELVEHQKCLQKAEKELDVLREWHPYLFMLESTNDPDPNRQPQPNRKPNQKDNKNDNPALKRLAQVVQDMYDEVSSGLQKLTKDIQDLRGK